MPSEPIDSSQLEGLILSINKPTGLSSFRVIAILRRITHIKRIGHAGTLDPFAEGVLVVGIGRTATRRMGEFVKLEKEYIARIKFGAVTDTDDHTGRVIQEREYTAFTPAQIEMALEPFRGDILQIPPRYSAIKHDGQRSYKLARKGIEPLREPRRVTISALELIETFDDGISIRVVCSSGTYIRSLGYDIGERLGCGGHLSELKRVRVGNYHVDSAIKLEEFAVRSVPIEQSVSVSLTEPIYEAV